MCSSSVAISLSAVMMAAASEGISESLKHGTLSFLCESFLVLKSKVEGPVKSQLHAPPQVFGWRLRSLLLEQTLMKALVC